MPTHLIGCYYTNNTTRLLQLSGLNALTLKQCFLSLRSRPKSRILIDLIGSQNLPISRQPTKLRYDGFQIRIHEKILKGPQQIQILG